MAPVNLWNFNVLSSNQVADPVTMFLMLQYNNLTALCTKNCFLDFGKNQIL